jgi:SNF2 family DNA or RNA helicase
LTAADYVLHMDPWWNPAVEDQATDRAHRMGQMRPLTVYRFIAAGTVEDTIMQMHESKRRLVCSVLKDAIELLRS